MSDPSFDVHLPKSEDLQSGPPSSESSDPLEELQQLLLGQQLEMRLDPYRVTPEAVANVLPQAVELTHIQPTPLVGAMRSTVEHAIKDSVNTNQDILADALFPVIGPATRKAVTAAIKSLTDSLNQGLELGLSPQSFAWRIEAWRTGRSFAEIVLLRTMIYQVEQVLLIHKKSGLMLQDLVAETATSQDPELVSAMLTALEDFVKDSFATNNSGYLGTVEFGDLNLWIEDAPKAVLACVIRGVAPTELRQIMKERLELIHRVFDRELDAFNGESSVFDAVQVHLEACLISQTKPKAKKQRSPLVWILILIVFGVGIGLIRELYLQHQWSNAVQALENQSGMTVLSSHRGWIKSQIRGLKDPLAPDPSKLLEAQGLDPSSVALDFEPYWSLDPDLSIQRAQKILSPPSGVRIRSPQAGVLEISGQATQSWVQTLEQLNPLMLGFESIDRSQLAILEKEQFFQLKQLVETTPLSFPEGSSQLSVNQMAAFDQLVQQIQQMLQLAAKLEQPIQLNVLGAATASGSPEDNVRLSQSRADTLMRKLIQRGIPAQVLKAQRIEVSPGSVSKAQVSFRVNLK